ncbi:MAG: glycosyltransferase family 2 protein [Candidatus Cloacimonetes bacterium]|nr:glycosyltransferase family 2 protein [Candidatus Cloacimonadota bacterium]
MNDTLSVVIPVYNEAEIIGEVLKKWSALFQELRIDYRIHVYNDGSSDNTRAIVTAISRKDPLIVVHDKPNSGHGATILQGYRENADSDWIFQIDSDDEMDRGGFVNLWHNRNGYDFLIGYRQSRKSSWIRKIMTLISRWEIRFFFGSGIRDVNSPYRLFRPQAILPELARIKKDTFAPNCIISGIVVKKKLRIYQCPVKHRNRRTGKVSIRSLKLVKAALLSFWQIIHYSLRVKYDR